MDHTINPLQQHLLKCKELTDTDKYLEVEVSRCFTEIHLSKKWN